MYAGRIYADFQNLDDDNRVLLTTAGTVRDLTAAGIALAEGASLALYTDDADDEGNADPLLAEARAEFDTDAGRWVARVDWGTLRNASALQATHEMRRER